MKNFDQRELPLLFDALKPFISPMVEASFSQISSVQSGVSSTLTAHSLDGAYHTGTLNPTQAPDFFMLNGSRTITGQVVIATSSAMPPFSLSAANQNQLVVGLRADSVNKQVIAGFGMTGGGTLTSNVTITLGNPTSLSSTSTNAVTSTSHSHVIDSSIARSAITISVSGLGLSGGGDLTANRTITLTSSSSPAGASILASDSSGNLSLQNLTAVSTITAGSDTDVTNILGRTKIFAVSTDSATLAHFDHATGTNYGWKQVASGTTILNAPTGQTIGFRINNNDIMVLSSGGLDISVGNLTLTSGQDFVVGSNLLFADGSQGNVGINCAPDPQFDLDVGGNFRAQGFIVGKHALQIKDARMICHFDGPEPYATNIDGETNGHMGQIGTSNSIVVFRPGKFGKCVEIAGTATNLVTNPQFDSGSTTGNTNYSTGTANGTRTAVLTRKYIGDYSLEVAKTAGAAADRWGFYKSISITTGNVYSFSCWVRIEGATGGTPEVRLVAETAFPSTIVDSTTVTDEWVLLSGSVTSTSTTTGRMYVWIQGCATGKVYVSAMQCTLSDTSVPYTSTSRASGGSLYFPSTNISTNKGTVSMWFRVPWGEEATTKPVAMLFSAGYDSFSVRKQNLVKGIIVRNNSSDVLTYTWPNWDKEWHHLTVTYTAETSTTSLYIDGKLMTTGSFSEFTLANIYVGGASSGVSHLDGWIDEFATIDRVLSASEILAIYESNAPIFAETSVFNFRAGNGLVWGDAEGLWMHNATGVAILGVSGVDSKSWGGRTLNTGDFSLGQYGASNGGWLLFDQIDTSSKPSLTMGYASTEAFRFDANGNKITGALTVTGSLIAGGATIDANGIGIAVDTTFGWSTSVGFQNVSVTTGRSYRFTGATGNNFLGMTGNYSSNMSTLAFVNENETVSGASKDSRVIIDTRSITDDAVSSVGSASVYIAASQWAPAQGVMNYAKISMIVSTASNISITLDSKLAEIKGALTYAILNKQSSTPTVYGSDVNQATIYFKGTKLIVTYNDGTVRYKYLDLAGTGVTWVHTTTAP